jgi:hypothetical protein
MGLLDAADHGWGGWGSYNNDDDPRGDDDVDDVRPRLPHTTINFFNEEKDGGRLLWTQIFKGEQKSQNVLVREKRNIFQFFNLNMYLFSCNTNSNFHPRESKIFIR